MSGTGKSVVSTFASGDQRIDGVMNIREWGDPTLSYSFPSNPAEYTYPYSGFGEQFGLYQASAGLQNTTRFILDRQDGIAANDGFSLEGFTALTVSQTTATDATIRIGQTSADPYSYGTAWAYYPYQNDETAGDVWLTDAGGWDYSNPVPGNYIWLTIIHEIGHALGLEHAHDDGAFGAVPADWDAMEFTVMSYRAYPGDPLTGGYSNEFWGYAQTYMMLDIAAFQHKYGANFSTNAGNTTYSWDPATGITYVNGAAAITPGNNRIFATIWDGGGIDTYDLSAYADNLDIDLAPGGASTFAPEQRVLLKPDDGGAAVYAQGSIYNALQYQGDPRSLIENATGGAGNDRIGGNAANNRLRGNEGNDTLSGGAGQDTLEGGTQEDQLTGGAGNDLLFGNAGFDRLSGEDGNDTLDGGGQADNLFGGFGEDLMYGGQGFDRLFGGMGDDTGYGGEGTDALFGEAGNDRLYGEDGNDRFFGGQGNDYLDGGNDNDLLIGGAGFDTLVGSTGNDTLEGKFNADTFLFTDFGGGFGQDTITDFEATNDFERISLRGVSAITDFTDLVDNHMRQSGAHVVIDDLNGNTITLLNTQLGDLLDGADFTF